MGATEETPTAAPDATLRVMVADDHAVVREGIKLLVNAQTDMHVVGEAANGDEAWRLACELNPDVLVMDLSMPVVDGAAATVMVRQRCPGVHVLALTVNEERSYLTQLLSAGASGYVLKRSAPSELVRAIRAVATGQTYIDPAVAGTIVQGYLGRQPENAESGVTLSDREMTVLRRISTGFSNKEIAAELGLSVKTIETYKARAAEKLGLATRVDIVRYAAQQGWLGPSTKDEA